MSRDITFDERLGHNSNALWTLRNPIRFVAYKSTNNRYVYSV